MNRSVLFGFLGVFVASCAPAGETRPILALAPGAPIPVSGGPQNVVTGDVNADGKPDLVVACGKGHVVVLLGDGKGGFRPALGSPLQLKASEMDLGDVNVDGKFDLALADHDSYAVAVLLGDGKGGFAPAPGSPFAMKDGQHPHTHGLALVDLNRDGQLDLVNANNDDNDVAVMLGNGRGGFARAPGSPFAAGPSPYPFAVGDVNGDGNLDLVAPNTKSGGKAVTVLLGDGKGGFHPGASLTTAAERPYFAALGDLTGDGKLDLVVAHDDTDRLTILLGDGRGGFRPAPGSPVALGSRAFGVVLVDVNRDGKTDAAVAAGEGVRVLLGDGHGGFTPALGSPFAAGKGVWRLVATDLNGDGKLDLAATGLESNSLAVFLGR